MKTPTTSVSFAGLSTLRKGSNCAVYLPEVPSAHDRIRMRSEVAANGGVIVQEFYDTRFGTSDPRCYFHQLLSVIEEGLADFDTVVVDYFSSLSHNPIEVVNLAERLQHLGIEIIASKPLLEPHPLNSMLSSVLAAFERFQSEELGKQLQEAKRANALRGFWSGGRPPYGYTTEPTGVAGKSARRKKLAIEPGEAATVFLIFMLYLKGDGPWGPLSVRQLAEWLNICGLRSRDGSRWSAGKIHRVLTDTTHIGTFEYGRHSKSGEVARVNCPAIITVADFEAAQRALKH